MIKLKRVILSALALAACLCLLSSCSSQAPEQSRADAIAAHFLNPASKYVAVASHRGDWRNYPENSIPAIESVIKMGVDIVELDIHLTKDSILVLSHDPDVKRCTDFRKVYPKDKSAKVCDLTYEEILQLRLNRGHGIATDSIRMPTLRQALLCCKGRVCVNIDKGFDYYPQVLELAKDLDMTGHIIIKSKMTPSAVDSVLAIGGPKLIYMPVIDAQKARGKLLFELYSESGGFPPVCELCWQNEEDDAFETMRSAILGSGSKIWVNTIWSSLCGGPGNDDDAAFELDDPGEVYQKYLDFGVSAIQTDRPEMLINWLEKQGRHKL